MNARVIFEKAKTIREYRLHKFGERTLTVIERELLEEKFSEFKNDNPRIFDEIVTNEIDWVKFKSLAEMAFSLHLQMNTDTPKKESRSVHFS